MFFDMEEMILNKLDHLETLALLGAKSVLTMNEARLFTGLAKSSLYKLTANKAIPHYKADGGKHIYFKKSELEDWMTRNRVSSVLEGEQAAIAEYLRTKDRKGGMK